jgi:hypothetical protein
MPCRLLAPLFQSGIETKSSAVVIVDSARPKRGRHRKYSPAQLAGAVAAVLCGSSLREASRDYFGVPSSTISDHVQLARAGEVAGAVGRPSLLALSDEYSYVAWVLRHGDYGLHLTRAAMKAKAQQIAEQRGLSFRGRLGLPSNNWFKGLRKRHPDLKMAKPKLRKSSEARAASLPNVQRWFDTLADVYAKYNVQPEQLFNVDETGFDRLGQSNAPVAMRADSKAVPVVVNSGWTEHITFIGAVSAAGHIVAPFFVFKGAEGHIPAQNWISEAVPGSSFVQTRERVAVANRVDVAHSLCLQRRHGRTRSCSAAFSCTSWNACPSSRPRSAR